MAPSRRRAKKSFPPKWELLNFDFYDIAKEATKSSVQAALLRGILVAVLKWHSVHKNRRGSTRTKGPKK